MFSNIFARKKPAELPDGLTRKDIRSDVIKIAWPALVELFLVQLCSMVDTMMVGKLGSWAISSVGYCTQPRFVLLAVFIAMNTGSTALISRSKGEGNREQSNTVFNHCIMMSTLLAIVVSMIGYAFSRQMVIFIGAYEEITINAATQYMQIQMLGFVFNALTMAITAALRGIGKTRVSMVYNMVSNIVNVIFNYLLIYGIAFFPRLEVAGASIATVIGQIVAFFIALYVVVKGNEYFKLDIKSIFKIDLSIVKRILRIGAPAMGEQLIMRIGMLIYVMTVASLGTAAYATHQIAASILSMSFMTGQAFGISATSLMGQSLGKGNPELGKATTLECRRLGMLCSILLACIFIFGGRYIAMLYTDEFDIVQEAAKILMVVAILQPLQSSQLIISGALRGAGDTRPVALVTFLGILIIRPLLSYTFIQFAGIGLIGAWLAMGLDQSFRSLCSYLYFQKGKWAYIKV